MFPHKSEASYPVHKLENELESHHPSFLRRCTKFLSKIIQNISSKKREQPPSISFEVEPTHGAYESDCHRAIFPNLFPNQDSNESQNPTSYTPNQLQELLLQDGSDCREHLLIVSARRAKENTPNGREFILVDVLDNSDPSRSTNLLMLDQRRSSDNLIGAPTSCQVCLRVSNGGSEQIFAQHCGYNQYQIRDDAAFSPRSNPFPLYTFLLSAEAVPYIRGQHDQNSSRWFTIPIWRYIKEIQSTARQVNHRKHALSVFPGGRRIYAPTSLSHPEISRFVVEMKRKELAILTSTNHESGLEIEEFKRENASLRTRLQDMA